VRNHRISLRNHRNSVEKCEFCFFEFKVATRSVFDEFRRNSVRISFSMNSEKNLLVENVNPSTHRACALWSRRRRTVACSGSIHPSIHRPVSYLTRALPPAHSESLALQTRPDVMLPSWLSLPLRNPSPLHVRLSCVSGQPITKQASVHTSIFLQSLIVPLSIFPWSCVSKNILMTLENPIVSIRILYLGLNIIGIFVYYGF